jgi:hypothetical protein
MQKKNIGIFVDSKKISGGAYQELLYNINELQSLSSKYNFIVLLSSKNLQIDLSKIKTEYHHLSLNIFQRYICFLRNFGSISRRLKKYFFFENKFEKFLKKKSIDLIFFTGPSQYSLYLENTKFMITVPDVMHREFPELRELNDNSEFQRKEEILSKSLSRAIKIFTNAPIIKNKISKFYNIEEKKIIIINHRPSMSVENFTQPDKEILNKIKLDYSLPTNYIFYPSMYLPHKNHKTIIDVLANLKINYKKTYQVVFCGNDLGYLKNIIKYSKQKDVYEQIKFLNFVEDSVLPYLYYESNLVLMTHISGPTMIPPWEAFKMHKPVIFPEIEGIQEVLGDAVIYANPFNVEIITDSLIKVYDDKNLRDALIEKGYQKYNEIKKNKEFKKVLTELDSFFKIEFLGQ